MNDSSDEEDDDEVLTECEEAVDDNRSDSEGDRGSDSNWFSVIYVAVMKIPLLYVLTQFSFCVYPPPPPNINPPPCISLPEKAFFII